VLPLTLLQRGLTGALCGDAQGQQEALDGGGALSLWCSAAVKCTGGYRRDAFATQIYYPSHSKRTVANAFEGSSYTSHAQSNRGQPVHNERRESNAQKHVQHQTSPQDAPVESNQVQHSATFNTLYHGYP